jgi:hypothetical protein
VNAARPLPGVARRFVRPALRRLPDQLYAACCDCSSGPRSMLPAATPVRPSVGRVVAFGVDAEVPAEPVGGGEGSSRGGRRRGEPIILYPPPPRSQVVCIPPQLAAGHTRWLLGYRIAHAVTLTAGERPPPEPPLRSSRPLCYAQLMRNDLSVNLDDQSSRPYFLWNEDTTGNSSSAIST